MKNTFCISFILCISIILLSFSPNETNVVAPKQTLSEYGFFKGDLRDLSPVEGVYPYQVNAPLFSDYAEKARFIALPSGLGMTYSAAAPFDFPVGSTIIKNFYYSQEQAHPEKGRRILETRLLLRVEKGWKALEYLWNAEQTDAVLEVAGATFPVAWMDVHGQRQAIEYVAPNLNQCKGCHSFDGAFNLLGINARQLNKSIDGKNQLLSWQKLGILKLPSDFDAATAPQNADYSDANMTDLNAKARAYLDANCGHCHNPHGPANTSGLYLDIATNDPEQIGINKPPVAAGRATKKLRYDIVPGKPQESILLDRMMSDDPGVRMPELGRQLAHQEGIALIRRWIEGM